MRIFAAYLIGLIFGVGISMSGMANPAKVINFFDVAGSWDASLAFVMGGAVIVTFFGYRYVLAKPAPLMEQFFLVPSGGLIDARLAIGSALFGVGWGIAGFCPGGALPAIGTGHSEVLLFIVALIAGIFAAKGLLKLTNIISQPHASRSA